MKVPFSGKECAFSFVPFSGKECAFEVYIFHQGWRNRGGHGPPKNLSGWARVCFGPPPPPKILTTGPPKWAASGQTPCQIAFERPKMCKIFKIFRLRRANMSRTYSSGDFMLFQSKFLYLVIFFSTKSNDFNNNLRS